MSISTYSELKSAVANWLNRSDLTAYIPDFIALGEARIYREMRIRAMEASLSSAISSGVVAVPSDYIELKHAYVDGSPTRQLLRADPEYIYAKFPTRSATAKPSYIARDGSNFIFGPYPDSAYTIKGTYYKRLTALSDSNTTNWFTTNAPGLLLFAALSEAEPFLKNDQRTLLWNTKYQQEKDGIMLEEETERYSGSGLAVTVR
jgi:hypothetical protein